jgi:hypothetical protein
MHIFKRFFIVQTKGFILNGGNVATVESYTAAMFESKVWICYDVLSIIALMLGTEMVPEMS